MRKLSKFFALAMAGIMTAGFISCGDEPTGETDGQIILSTDNIKFTVDGDTKFVVVTGENWTAVPSAEWINVEPAEGRISIIVGANATVEERSGTITVSNADDSKTITVMQEAISDTSLSVDPDRLVFDATGGVKTVAVTSNLAWDANPNKSWIIVEPADDGKTFTVTVGPNETGDERIGSISIDNGENNTAVIVTQLPDGSAYLSIDIDRLDFEANDQYFHTVTVTSELAWEATPSHDWILISRPASGNFIVGVSANGIEEARIGTITVDNGKNDAIVTVVQAAKGITILVEQITLNKTSITLEEGGTTFQLSATILPQNATWKKINWTSSNPAVATVTVLGTVQSVGAGNATIIATADDGSNIKAECAVTVTPIDNTEIVPISIMRYKPFNVGSNRHFRLKFGTYDFAAMSSGPGTQGYYIELYNYINSDWTIFTNADYIFNASGSEGTVDTSRSYVERYDAAGNPTRLAINEKGSTMNISGAMSGTIYTLTLSLSDGSAIKASYKGIPGNDPMP